MNLMLQGHKVKGVKPMNEQEAIQSGAELLSEGLVLTVGVGALVLESRRSARANAEKVEQKAKRRAQKIEAMQHLNDTMRDLGIYSYGLREVLAEHEKRREAEVKAGKRKWDPISLPPIPKSIEQLIGTKDSPTDIVVQAHRAVEAKKNESSWEQVGATLSMTSLTHAIKFFGRMINGEDAGDDGDDEEDDATEE